MAKKKLNMNVQIRSTPKAKAALDRVVATLRGSDAVSYLGKPVTQEAVVNAVWLWLDSLPDEQVEAIMMDWMPKLERLLEPGPVSRSYGLPDDSPVQPGGRMPVHPEPDEDDEPRRLGSA